MPNHQGWCAKLKLGRNAYTLQASFGVDLHAQSVFIDKKILRRSSGGSLLRVRCWLGGNFFFFLLLEIFSSRLLDNDSPTNIASMNLVMGYSKVVQRYTISDMKLALQSVDTESVCAP